MTLSEVSKIWLDWMWAMTWQVTGLVVFVYVACAIFKSSSARLKHMLWLLVLARLIIPPTWSNPIGLAWWIGSPLSLVSVKQPIVSSDVGIGTPRPIDNLNSSVTATGSIIPSSATEASETEGPSMRWADILLVLWLGVLSMWACLHVMAWLRLRKWIHRAEVISDRRVLTVLDRATEKVGLDWPIELRDSAACATPLVARWLDPVILLPTDVHQLLDDDELESVLVHELTHIRRWDAPIRQLQSLLLAMYFFHPAVWLAFVKIGRTREEACDEQTVAALGGIRKPYASAIVKSTCELVYEPPHLALGMVDPAYPTKQRLQRILSPGLPTRPGGSFARFCIVIALAAILLPAGIPGGEGESEAVAVGPEEFVTRSLEKTSTPIDSSMTAGGAAVIERSVAGEVASPEQTPNANAVSGKEDAWIERLTSSSFSGRMEAYQTLERIGSEKSFESLMTAFLEHSGLEQDAAKRALDAVRSRLPAASITVEPGARTVRVYADDGG